MISEKCVKEKLILLLSIDSKSLMARIKQRRLEYLEIFSLRRTREHFKEIFFSRYNQVSINDLKLLSEETIIALKDFYEIVEKMSWYFYATKDMPNAVEDRCEKYVKSLETSYATLSLYLEGESEKPLEEGQE